MKKILLALLAIALLSGCDQTPKTYEDCILANAGKANSDKGALLVNGACRKKFPQPNPFDQFDQQPQGK